MRDIARKATKYAAPEKQCLGEQDSDFRQCLVWLPEAAIIEHNLPGLLSLWVRMRSLEEEIVGKAHCLYLLTGGSGHQGWESFTGNRLSLGHLPHQVHPFLTHHAAYPPRRPHQHTDPLGVRAEGDHGKSEGGDLSRRKTLAGGAPVSDNPEHPPSMILSVRVCVRSHIYKGFFY